MIRVGVRRTLALLLAAGVILALVFYVGPADVVATLAGANPFLIVAAMASYALFFAFRGLRWHRLLRNQAPEITAIDAANLTAVGWLVSTFVPMKAGDVTRSAVVAYRAKRNVAGIIGTVAVERALDIVALAAASTVGLIGLALAHHVLPSETTRAVVFAWLLPPLGLIVFMLFARTLAKRSSKNIFVRYAHLFLQAADELRQRPRAIPALVLLSLASTACQVGVFTFLFLALAPAAPLGLVAVGVPLFLLSFIVAITPGNVGTYEAAFAAIYFALLAWDPQELLSIAVAVHLLTITTVTILGGLAFALDRVAHAPPQRAAPPPERASTVPVEVKA